MKVIFSLKLSLIMRASLNRNHFSKVYWTVFHIVPNMDTYTESSLVSDTGRPSILIGIWFTPQKIEANVD